MSDHNIENMLMSGIWAMGQDVNNYFHSPNSGLESCSASDPRLVITKKRSCCFNSSTACIFILKLFIGYCAFGRFYRHDELKYHGSGPEHRGVFTINFHGQ